MKRIIIITILTGLISTSSMGLMLANDDMNYGIVAEFGDGYVFNSHYYIASAYNKYSGTWRNVGTGFVFFTPAGNKTAVKVCILACDANYGAGWNTDGYLSGASSYIPGAWCGVGAMMSYRWKIIDWDTSCGPRINALPESLAGTSPDGNNNFFKPLVKKLLAGETRIHP